MVNNSPGPAKPNRLRRNRITGTLLLLLALPLWELIRQLSGVSPLLMPSLADITAALFNGFTNGSLPQQILISLGFIAGGGLLAISAALLVSVTASHGGVVDSALRSLASLMHPLPGVVLLPVIILWMGTGPAAVLTIIVHSIFWPLLANLQAGIRSIPRSWQLIAANYSLSGWRLAFQVTLPASSPWLLAGLRIAWARAWRAFITAELLFGAVAAGGGLGWYVHSRRVFMDSPGLYAGIIVIMAIGSLVENVLFRQLEQRTIQRWGMSL
ncbi:MAG: ABC transporter permease subunit [Spirochaetes bacterium]|nr:ABC transporter permease subunit [Spirochaetota bacterium]MBU0956666.1 ABC transporter permease subunit [Spirochaetota bacterium]